MILLYIHLAIGGLSLILFGLLVADTAHQFKTRYPNRRIIRKTSSANLISSLIKMVITCYLPLINIVLLCTLMFKDEPIKESIIRRVYEKSEEITEYPSEADNI